jgi:hypothetical protein
MTVSGDDLEQWNSPDGMKPVGEALMEYVSEIHAENLTGIRFVGAGHDQSRLKNDGSASTGLFDRTTGCQLQPTTTGALTWAENEFDIDLDDHLLHLVFVDQVAGNSVGEACPASGRNGRLVVLEWGESDRGWLAHELGHQLALGLELPLAGHTTSYTTYFDHTNAMATNRQTGASTNQTHFSLGQTFRMNFDERSWLSLAVPGSDTRRCDGQFIDPLKEGECPVLQADFVPSPPP